jgi:uncharacterized membrane protein
VVAAVAGLGDSLYLTFVHYSSTPLACVQAAIVNCDLVTRSSYSVIPGTSVPVSMAGLIWFAASLGLGAASRIPRVAPSALFAHFAWGLAGLMVVLYLVYAELRLGVLCEWCTAAHILVVVSLLVATARLASSRTARKEQTRQRA